MDTIYILRIYNLQPTYSEIRSITNQDYQLKYKVTDK